MAGDGTRAGTALHRLRARWLAPSPPLAVDDEPLWSASPDPASEDAGGEPESDRQESSPAA
ncbi:MAG TPA: hypothetical protein VFD90_15470 [Gaiellales bacterium]|jgi:hypothetical protein|nr:hypothetical protein [Gaiellales bacterium]